MTKKSLLSSNCSFCGKSFYLSKSSRKLHCGNNCSSKKNRTICCICSKEFKNNAQKVVCSKKCLLTYIKCFLPKKNKTLFWNLVSSALSSNSKVIKKSWGFEIHFCNNNNYCMKYLVYFKNNKSSLHFHRIKTELWYCLCGSFDCLFRKSRLRINTGDKLEINPGDRHQLTSLQNSIILEVSTRDFPEDSIKKLAPR